MALPIRDAVQRMRAYTPGEQPQGTVTKLNTNEHPALPSPRVLETLSGALEDGGEFARRYPDPVSTLLREALARDCGVDGAQVIVGNGSDEVLRMLALVTIDPGSKYGTLEPTYSYYDTITAVYGGVAVRHELDEDLRLPPSLLSGEERILFIANPNPPFGTLYGHEAVERICQARPDTVVVVDEAYIAFAPDGSTCAGLVSRHPNLAVTRSFSKSHSLAGLRVGFAIAGGALMDALSRVKDSYNVNALSQRAAIAAIEDTEHFERQRRAVIEERDRLAMALTERGFAIPPSHGNFLFAFHHQARDIFESLRERGIFVRYFDTPRTRLGMRITVGRPDQTDTLLSAIDEIFRQ